MENDVSNGEGSEAGGYGRYEPGPPPAEPRLAPPRRRGAAPPRLCAAVPPRRHSYNPL